MNSLRVIFHEATRTGSPRTLSDLLRIVGPDLGVPLDVELLAGGPLSSELMALTDTPSPQDPPSAVLINSALAASEAYRFEQPIKVAVYVHEVGEALRTLPESASEALRKRCDLVWCVSEQSARDLAEMAVDPTRIRVLPPLVRQDLAVSEAQSSAALGKVGLSIDDQLVVACGEAGWRKGADLFVDLARRMATGSDLTFVWVGRRPRAFGRVLDHDTRNLRLEERLVWTGELDDAAPFLAAASVVVVPSREDPQPLVPLEAALLGTPSVGFATGGMASMGESGAAIAVRYPDTRRLAEAAERVLKDRILSRDLVTAATTKVARSHSIEALREGFLEGIHELLGVVDTPHASTQPGSDRRET